MAIEKKRGCGYRKVGGLYLVGEGRTFVCDSLPLQLFPCDCCGFDIPWPQRSFMWVKKRYFEKLSYVHRNNGECKCLPQCPICHPENNDQEKYGFMWVGKRHYTPESFRLEAEERGACKRVNQIPKGLKLGETWVLLGHHEVPIYNKGTFGKNGLAKAEPEKKPAIFYGFKPVRVEMPIWKSKATKRRLKALEKQGITPVIIPDGDKDHASKKSKKKR